MIDIKGPWKHGYALNIHTLSSKYLGDDENGHPQFETIRSEAGELLYRSKYRGDKESADKLIDLFLREQEIIKLIKDTGLIVSVPSNTTRPFDHIQYIAGRLAAKLNIKFRNDLLSKITNVEIKLLSSDEKRKLDNIILCKSKNDGPKIGVVLFDDLYDSGKTMTDCFNELNISGYKVKGMITITRNRISD